ncbi:MAG: family 10 glycosylhydrolase [Oscillospiraceae bacterium]|nr:family 10 glycosylhydrolase [Oscillospiraceae bacterium]
MKKKILIFSICLVVALGIVIAVQLFMLPNMKKADQTNGTSQSGKLASDDIVTVFNPDIGTTGDNMRAVWVTYYELDMAGTDYSQQAFVDKFTEIAENSKEYGFNTLIVQVRPFADALYESKYFPSSHIVAKTQGAEIGYDPLKIMCEIAHSLDMQIHAWLNPYRIAGESLADKLSENNPYVKNNALGIKWENQIYFDPSQKEVRRLIISGVEEIVKNYDIDGIQYDDYFYPTQSESFDQSSYKAYKESRQNSADTLDLATWRKANVSMLIADTYYIVHHTKPKVMFGVSPQGNLANNAELYADVAAWCNNYGYIDYICPQIYFSMENPAKSFGDALNDWLQLPKRTGLKLYIGLAGYKAGTDKDEGTWQGQNDILQQQIKIIEQKELHGFMLFSYGSLLEEAAAQEMANVVLLLNGED